MSGRRCYDFTLLIGITLLVVSYKSLQTQPEVNYCDKKLSCGDTINFVCQLRHNCEISPNCKDFDPSPLSLREKQIIRTMHNKFRSEIALGHGPWSTIDKKPLPSASNMREMVWDKELEFLAQCWANQCHDTHDPCRKKSDGTPLGQSMGANTFGVVSKIIKNFYDEGANVTSDMIKSFDQTKGTEHFTQLAHWNNSQIGCARAQFYSRRLETVLGVLVCNYAGAGNLPGQEVYQIGKPCDGCLSETCNNGLCLTLPSETLMPNICKASQNKFCKPIVNEPVIRLKTQKPNTTTTTSKPIEQMTSINPDYQTEKEDKLSTYGKPNLDRKNLGDVLKPDELNDYVVNSSQRMVGNTLDARIKLLRTNSAYLAEADEKFLAMATMIMVLKVFMY